MTNDKLADEIERKLGEGHWDSIGLEHDKWAQIIAALRAERPQSGEMVMVPRRLSAEIVVEIANQVGVGAAAVIDTHNLMLSLAAAEAETKGKP